MTIPNCPNFFSVFSYYKDMISCDFKKFFMVLELWLFKVFPVFRWITVFVVFSDFRQVFLGSAVMPQRFFLFGINTCYCVVLEPKQNLGKCCCMKERLPEIKIFYNSEAFWASIYQKSNKIPTFFLNIRIKDQVGYQIIAKDQWALLAEGKKMRS